MGVLSAIVIFLLSVHLASGQVSLEFDTSSTNTYTVDESDGELQVCLRAVGTVSEEFSVTLQTTPSTAVNGEDYINILETLTYAPFSSTTRCVDITIINDDALEEEEVFFLLATTSATGITAPPITNIVISNDDFILIEFNQSSYTALESGPGKVCVSLVSGIIGRSVSFTVTQSAGTATRSSDYIQSPLEGIIPVDPVEPTCVNIPLISDQVVEEEYETVFLTMTSIDSPSDTATLNIMDDDGVTVELSSTQLSVTEGDSGTTSLDLCVQITDIQASLDRDVPLLLNTQTSSAGASDFIPLVNEEFIIPASTPANTDVCYQISILGDSVCEQSELFSATVAVTNTLDTLTGSDEAEITVFDNGDTLEDCGALTVSGGMVQYSATTAGSVAVYTCDTGYIMEGEASRTCQGTGLQCQGAWSGNAPTCRLANCGPLLPPNGGSVSVPSTTFNSVATYSCSTGYNLNGMDSRTCLIDEVWSGTPPTCEIVQCSPLEDLENGDITFSDGVNFNSLARYSCNEGYDLVGATLRLCRSIGVWSGLAPFCRPVDCLGLSDPPDGMVEFSETTFMSTATYSCLEGFALIGESTRECLSTEQWSGVEPTCVVECGDLPAPGNGAVSFSDSTLVGSVATFSCTDGYIVTGDSSIRTCMSSGVWSGSQPTCEPVDCMGEPDPENGQAIFTTTTLGSVLSYSCNQGFTPSSTEDRICLANGEWSGDPVTCSSVTCDQLFAPSFGSVTFSSDLNFGSVAEYSCTVGYELSSLETRTCQQNGEWSGTMPTCSLVDCGEPSPLNNGGTVVVTLTTFQSISVYSCPSGHTLSVVSTIRTCQEDGNWSGPDPTCDPVDCGPLTSPDNGQVDTVPSTTFTSTATYTCDAGHDLVGVVTERVCEASGSWSMSSSPDPVCNPVDCGTLLSPLDGEVSFTTTTFLSVADYSCNSGYVRVGVASQTCQANREWSAIEPTCNPVNCSSLSPPINGAVDLSEGVSLGAIATYSCTLGYRLRDGDEQRTCTPDAVWSGTEPSCILVTCPDDRVDPVNGFIQLMTGLTFDSIVVYQCNSMFALDRESTQRCGEDGFWTGQPPMCIRINCPERDPPVNGTVMDLTADVVQFSCDPGFDIDNEDHQFSLCDPETGTWGTPVPNCIIQDCGPPPGIERGSVVYTNTVYLSEATYSCESGFRVQPNASAVRVCEVGGEWEETGTCEPVDCGPLNAPMNGMVMFSSTIRQSVAEYECASNYTLVGEPTRECADSGQWSNLEPVCEDIDECELRQDVCDQECNNTVGGYQCYCQQGYTLVNFSVCEDINECSSNKGECAQMCNNTPGSRECFCLSGYRLDADNVNCNNINECLESLDNCHDDYGICTDTAGGFTCECKEGFQGNGIFCEDIDECETGDQDCSTNANCTNTVGSFTCTCHEGFAGTGRVCEDINECQEDLATCAANATCNNTIGSYDCLCDEGFTGDGFINCTDIDECEQLEMACHSNATCGNTIGSFSCSCDPGYSGDGLNCINIDECVEGIHDCHPDNADCTDIDGSFICTCKVGFTGDGLTCTELCKATFQMVLGGVVNCSVWRLDATDLKLVDTSAELTSQVQQACTNCSLQSEQITGGQFTCPAEHTPDQVTYRANLRGNTNSDCDGIIEVIETWIQSAQASITIQGSPLAVASNCEVSVDSLTSPLECVPVTTMGTGEATSVGVVPSESVPVALVAGAAGGGVLALIIVLVVLIAIVCLLTTARRRKRKSVEIPGHFVDDPVANDYTYFTAANAPPATSPGHTNANRPLLPQTSITNFLQHNDMKESTFNPDGDVIPMLGRSYSTMSRDRNRIKAIASKTEQAAEGGEDFYDRVYDDKAGVATTNIDTVGPEMEEIYDDGMDINPDEIYDAVASERGDNDKLNATDDGSFNDSFESSGDESLYDKADLGLDIKF